MVRWGRKWKICMLVTACLLVGSIPSVSYADPSTTQQEIDAAERERDQLEEQQEENEEELTGLRGEQRALRNHLDNLNRQLTEVSERLNELDQQIRDKEQAIADTREALSRARETEEAQHEYMERHIQYTYERGETNLLVALFAADSFAEFLNMIVYAKNVAEYSDQLLEEYIANREFIEQQEAELVIENEELNRLHMEAESEKDKVTELISQTSREIANYGDQIQQAEADALAYEAELKRLDEDLDALRKKLAEEIARSQQAANSAWRDISEVNFAEGDRYLLANLIYCEAGAEPYEGQVAVGAVVINRVLSSVFPDTVVGVIYQNRQFSPVASGRLELALANNRATDACYRAADAAMSGMTNVGNCVYFRTPIPGLTGTQIGGHIFY